MALKPLNDLAKIELDSDVFGFGGEKDTAECGVLVELPDQFNYFGMWSFAFEESFMAKEKLEGLYDYWSTKIGRKVYWTALSEKGNIIKDGTKKYALVKLTSLIAEDEADSDAQNLHGDGAGSFRA